VGLTPLAYRCRFGKNRESNKHGKLRHGRLNDQSSSLNPPFLTPPFLTVDYSNAY
jgi:hypothetical protein